MLKVIGAGFPRTGTSSMKAALDRLGFGPCHHMYTIMAVPELGERWAWVARADAAGRRDTIDWNAVFAGFSSEVDWPASFYWRELAAAFPEAKVLLTVREPHGWYASARNTVFSDRTSSLTSGVSPSLEGMKHVRPALELMCRAYFGTELTEIPDEETAIAAFERHNAQVRAAIPADRLLVYELGRGWEPLCRFLGVELPVDEPFPHLNDTESMQRMMRRVARGEALDPPL
ncbi:sulfotransferase family protein [Nocardiopsis ansamitocini]|uniref:Sulfotransferase family protein n=1 Tax=Nocardiopsis ansamitocini TaxID=1670832 RepID=A0A9W6P7G0_9ACTN|nr:sulfotransferase family protein [Nocardiopsis ansamitocini]GLU48426.1 sulfotransferase family protein [Nocardiopsis ansamitocini]